MMHAVSMIIDVRTDWRQQPLNDTPRRQPTYLETRRPSPAAAYFVAIRSYDRRGPLRGLLSKELPIPIETSKANHKNSLLVVQRSP
jgi:hypothetical protein